MPAKNTIFSTLSAIDDKETYLAARASYFKPLENRGLFLSGPLGISAIHNDDKNYPTIGYGYNLTDWNPDGNPETEDYGRSIEVNTAYFTHVFGTLTGEQEDALELIDKFNSKTAIQIDGITRTLTIDDLENPDEAIAVVDNKTIPLAALLSLVLSEAQATILLNAFLDGIPGYPGAEERLNAKLASFSPTLTLPDSEERLAVLSMFYQVPALVGEGLMTALANDNRAEAWFQIRYKHLNSDSVGLQNRKNDESDKYALTRTEDLDEYAEALAYLYTNHRQTIDERDANSPFLAAIATQKEALENAYTNGEPVDFIYMGTDSSTHQDKLGGNDLIFGDATAASTLHGDSEPVRPRTALLSTYEICRNSCRNFCRNFFRTANCLRFVLPARLISIFAVLDSCSSARQTQEFSSKDRQRIHGRGSVCQAKGNCT